MARVINNSRDNAANSQSNNSAGKSRPSLNDQYSLQEKNIKKLEKQIEASEAKIAATKIKAKKKELLQELAEEKKQLATLEALHLKTANAILDKKLKAQRKAANEEVKIEQDAADHIVSYFEDKFDDWYERDTRKAISEKQRQLDDIAHITNQINAELDGARTKSTKDLNKQLLKLNKERELKLRAEKNEAELELAKRSFENAKTAAEQQAAYEDLMRLEKEKKDLDSQKKIADQRKADEERIANQRKTTEKAIQKLAQEGFKQAAASIEEYAKIYSKYMPTIDARLQGSGKSFTGLASMVRRNVSLSPFVTQGEVYESLANLVSTGISYNLEERAFLGSLSDKIATTFSVNNRTLLDLIKIQQTDTTRSRLGMEAFLTRYLNATYENTEYLSTKFDDIEAAIYDATAQLSASMGTEFEFVVQKWFSSLSSVGVTDSTLSSLAQGLNALGTGDIDLLSSNAGLQNLLVMSASRAGKSYVDLLTNPLTAEDTNELLKSVVGYVKEISSTNNQVVRSQFAKAFGVSVTDMRALANLSQEDIDNIFKSNLTYGGMQDELAYQLQQIPSRLHLSTMIENVLSNTMASIGGNIAGNAITYGLWRATDLVESITGGIAIPTVGVLGSFLGLNSTVENLMRTGIIGLSTISTLVGAVGSAMRGGALNLDQWGAATTTRRGQGIILTDQKFTSGESVSYEIVTSGGEDMGKSAVSLAKEQAAEEYKGDQSSVDEEDKYTKILTSILEYLKERFPIGEDNPLTAIDESNISLADIYRLLDDMRFGSKSWFNSSLG